MRKNEVSPTEKLLTMKDLYHEEEDPISYRMPKPLGREVNIHYLVDSDHAGNLVTRRSHTGIMIYLNNAPIIWYSKKKTQSNQVLLVQN